MKHAVQAGLPLVHERGHPANVLGRVAYRTRCHRAVSNTASAQTVFTLPVPLLSCHGAVGVRQLDCHGRRGRRLQT